ncbi:MAG TPA: base excision DNA repair protein [Terriglobales bacterium]|nr:base excision DNA repair protein [Terriglobales bacterium]
MDREASVRAYYQELMAAWGPQDWWPAYTRLEVIVGAFLTQNTAWTNVERALRRLREGGAFNLDGIRRTPLAKLAGMIRSSGYFRQKARRLKTFVSYLDARYGGSLERMFAQPTDKLREELLALNGVGPETADSILLYAGGHPVFVVDAYTRRIFERHGLITGKAQYEDLRRVVERAFQQALPPAPGQPPVSPLAGRRRHKFVIRGATSAARAFDEFHALLVQTAKHHCLKAEALCAGCPLERFLEK